MTTTSLQNVKDVKQHIQVLSASMSRTEISFNTMGQRLGLNETGKLELSMPAHAISLLTSFPESSRHKIIQWLFKTDPSSNHYTACKKHEPNTGMWFFRGHEMDEWKRSPNSLLWLYGSRKCKPFTDEINSSL